MIRNVCWSNHCLTICLICVFIIVILSKCRTEALCFLHCILYSLYSVQCKDFNDNKYLNYILL